MTYKKRTKTSTRTRALLHGRMSTIIVGFSSVVKVVYASVYIIYAVTHQHICGGCHAQLKENEILWLWFGYCKYERRHCFICIRLWWKAQKETKKEFVDKEQQGWV